MQSRGLVGAEAANSDEEEGQREVEARPTVERTPTESARGTEPLESSPEMLEGESPPVSPDDPMLNLMRALLGNFHTTLTNKIENMQQQNHAIAAEIQRDIQHVQENVQRDMQQVQENIQHVQESVQREIQQQNQVLATELKEQQNALATELTTKISAVNDKVEAIQRAQETGAAELKNEVDKKLEAQARKVEEQSEKIETVQNKCEEMNTRIDSITEFVEIRTKRHEDKIAQELKGISNQVEVGTQERLKVLTKLNDLQATVDTMPAAVGSTHPLNLNVPPTLKFSGLPEEHPYSFLKALDSFMALSRLPEQYKTHLLYQILQKNARTWLETLEPFPQTIQEFKIKFLNRYWSEEIQLNHKMTVMNTYYKPTLGSMRDYAAGKIAALKLCSPPMEDKEIICLLTRHFPYSIQNLIRSIAPRDIEAFQSLLGNYDITADNVMKGGKTSTTINAISTSVGGQEAKSSKQSDQPNNKKNDRNTEENNFRNETKDRTSKPGGRRLIKHTLKTSARLKKKRIMKN